MFCRANSYDEYILYTNNGVFFLPKIHTQGPRNNVSIIKNYDKTQALYPRYDI